MPLCTPLTYPECTAPHLCYQLFLDFQLLGQLVLPLLEGDAAAALAVFDPDTPVLYLLQEVAGTQLVFNAQHSGSDGRGRGQEEVGVECVFTWAHVDLWPHFIFHRVPVEVEDVVEDFRVPVKEELVAVDDIVVTQIQPPAVVWARGQPADPCLWIPGS